MHYEGTGSKSKTFKILLNFMKTVVEYYSNIVTILGKCMDLGIFFAKFEVLDSSFRPKHISSVNVNSACRKPLCAAIQIRAVWCKSNCTHGQSPSFIHLTQSVHAILLILVHCKMLITCYHSLHYFKFYGSVSSHLD